MPWTETARREYARASTRYASDLSDREWGLVRSFLPPPKPVGRPWTAVRSRVYRKKYVPEEQNWIRTKSH